MPAITKKKVAKTEEERGYIYLPAEIWSSDLIGRFIKVICGETMVSARVDRKHRILCGKQFMQRAGLTLGTPIELMWRKHKEELVINIVREPTAAGRIPYNHNEIRDIVAELGRLRGLHAEIEYPINGRRLDVIWKKVRWGAPIAVFEVHIRGNVFEALIKLMRARERWPGAEIFLITTSEHADKARDEVRELTIASALHVVNCDTIIELYELIKRVRELEKACKIP